MPLLSKKRIVYVLIGLGFAGLIGAHEVTPPAGEDPNTIIPFILAAAGTVCFVGAGLMALKLMRENASK